MANFLRRKAQKFGPSTIRITFVLRKFSENVRIANSMQTMWKFYVDLYVGKHCHTSCDWLQFCIDNINNMQWVVLQPSIVLNCITICTLWDYSLYSTFILLEVWYLDMSICGPWWCTESPLHSSSLNHWIPVLCSWDAPRNYKVYMGLAHEWYLGHYSTCLCHQKRLQNFQGAWMGSQFEWVLTQSAGIYVFIWHSKAPISLYPLSHTCKNLNCTNTCLLKHTEPQQVVIYTLGDGVQPAWSIHLYCPSMLVHREYIDISLMKFSMQYKLPSQLQYVQGSMNLLSW